MTYIPAALRRQVIERAGGCCEYCWIQIIDRLLPFEIDHIIAEKHGGATDANNLCVACYRCNGFKGSDIASADPETGNATLIYHPRKQSWDDHFQLVGAIIEPLSSEGRVTIFLLRFNMPIHIAQRRALPLPTIVIVLQGRLLSWQPTTRRSSLSQIVCRMENSSLPDSRLHVPFLIN